MAVDENGYFIFESFFDITREPSTLSDNEICSAFREIQRGNKGISFDAVLRDEQIAAYFQKLALEVGRRFISKWSPEDKRGFLENGGPLSPEFISTFAN